ncbi:hypothetical protein B842_03035 [Corynebacterium humireducens NBRC 106098 = DSM 45392]|uniref:Uncharacterized protein n=1 Tax=Corynebacterium humireducens NBRC 106098 = DSM 45392 TaxID=1223515 RepID=A0A0B5D0Z7_9CORY|nr:hypothetical protein [Corynebacterium humireducens]AJE32460.1 hypothetical protein B842_03035 [Corynebacterium humireducens NBRC 106098 = DSM 45392]
MWELGLSYGDGGVGCAITGAAGVQLMGSFPTLARAVDVAARATDGAPQRVVLVHPADLPVTQLGRVVGDLALAGVTGDDVQLLTDVEVLHRLTGHRVLLIDADRDLLTVHPGRSERFDADRVAALVAKHPWETTVALTGHPENRDRYHVAVRDHGPMIVERAALAALALQVPATTALSSTPRTAGALRRRPVAPWVLAAIPVIALILLILLL